MSDDLFDRAARALRDRHDGRSDAAVRTRARVLAVALVERKRRRIFAFAIAPLAAAFVVSMAWAASTGRLTGWIEHVTALVRPERSAQPVATPPSALPSITASATSSDAAPIVEVETAPDAGPALTPIPRAPVAAPSRVPKDVATPDAGPSEEDALYLRAHQAHFVAHDAAAALRGWDDYLRAYPSGRFAIEARYNRALALVRLARYAEARAALAPFAAGTYGGYRQREARALLDAMDAGP